MPTKHHRRFRLAGRRAPALTGLVLLLTGCGGGGGSGSGSGDQQDSALVYAGNNDPAVITAANAASLVANLMGDLAAPTSIGPRSAVRPAALRSAPLASLRRMSRLPVRTTAAGTTRLRHAAAIRVDETEPCRSGSFSVRGTLDDTGLGTLAFEFVRCRDDDATIDGRGTLRIDALDASGDITDATMQFAVLRFSNPAGAFRVSGSVRVRTDAANNAETATLDVIIKADAGPAMWKTEALTIVTQFDTSFLPSAYVERHSGRLYDAVHGYVAIATLAPLSFGDLDAAFPDRGGRVLLTGAPGGAGNQSILVTAVSAAVTWLALDLDGDGADELSAFVKWSDLPRPIAADLNDDDGDGMHTSWETAFGLDPQDPADAELDGDGDRYGNLREYRGGGDPNDASVLPTLGKLAFAVAAGVATADSNESNPGRAALASDGERYLLVSCRTLGADAGLFGVFVTRTGAGEPFPIAQGECNPLAGTSEDSIGMPAVAFDGTNYLVVYVRGALVRGTRVSRAGVALDGSAGFPISTGQLFSTSSTTPSVAFDGTSFLVVWSKFIPVQGASTRDVYGAIVSVAGEVSEEIPIAVEQRRAPDEFGFVLDLGAPAVSFDGTNHLVVWNQVRTGPGESAYSSLFAPYSDVAAARVTPQGDVLDPQALLIATAGPFALSPGTANPRVAFDGTNHLAVWKQRVPSAFEATPTEIRAARVSPDAELLDGPASARGFAVNTAPVQKSDPALVFDGVDFLVAWVVGAYALDPPAGLFGAKVSPDGILLTDPAGHGLVLSDPPPANAKFVLPTLQASSDHALLVWLNNNELSGQAKSIEALSIFP